MDILGADRYLKWFLLQVILLLLTMGVFGVWLGTSVTNGQAALLTLLLCAGQVLLCYQIAVSTKEARSFDRILVMVIPALLLLISTAMGIGYMNGAERL